MQRIIIEKADTDSIGLSSLLNKLRKNILIKAPDIIELIPQKDILNIKSEETYNLW